MRETASDAAAADGAGRGLIPYDLSRLFERYMRRKVRLQLDPRLAPLLDEAETLRLGHVLRGFTVAQLMLDRRGFAPGGFAMIGPGSGAEAIGAAHIFRSVHRLVIADPDPLILATAAGNIRRHVEPAIDVTALPGTLDAPLATGPFPVDLLYADLIEADLIEADLTEADLTDRPAMPAPDAVLNAAGLGAAYRFLSAAAAPLSARGAVLILLGMRFPHEILGRLAAATRMRFRELEGWLQPQAAPQHALPHLAAAETPEAEFDFYDLAAVPTGLTRRLLPGAELKAALTPWRLSAGAALHAWRTGRRIGHTAQLMLATPIRF